MSKEKHMKKRKHNFIYYLAPIVVLIAIFSVSVSYFFANSGNKQQPKTETANKQKTVATSSSLQKRQSNSKENSQTNTQQATLNDKASYPQLTMDDLQKLIIPSEFDGVWYYYDTATEKVETLKIY